nr:hypothetical protein [Tanacetum cinerariifolium]
MALPDKHQLKFNLHKDAKTLIEAIEKRFRRNTKTKKVQKTLLKQQYENFTSFTSESLDQIHDRLQKLISKLEIHRRNKTDLEEQSLDDLFNSFKIYEAEVKSSSSASTSTQILAFVSSFNTDNTNEPVSASASVSAVSAKLLVSTLPNVDFLSNAVIYSFFASQSTSPQLENDDLKQIDADDLEEMDLKWQMAMLTVECYNCHIKGHLTRECRSLKDTKRNGAEEEPTNYALMAFSSLSSSSDNEARLLVYQQNESVFDEDIKLLKLEVQLRDNDLVTLKQNLEKVEQERDDLKLKLEKFQTSFKTGVMKVPPSPIYDMYQSGNVYHVVPLPYTGTFMPPKPDLVFNTAPNDVETDHSAFNVKLSLTKPDQALSHTLRPSAPIIEDWHVKTSIPTKIAIPKPTSNDKRNMSYLSDFEELNGGYVAFGGNLKGGKISGKGKIKTGKLDFDDVYFVKELKFNLFSVSQMCDKKNSVLFTDTECLVLSSEFKLPDENQVLLRVPRENNMYNDKQHRASCKTKPISSVNQPLYRLYMDLFGPTFVKSMNKKSYCLVITDDYSRFTWVFFLATKDETSLILKTFISGLENQLSLKVKVIRSDNETGFKNHDLNQFCGMKGIKRKSREEIEQQYVLFSVWSSVSTNPQNSNGDAAFDEKEPEFEERKPESEVNVSPSSSAQSKKHDDKTKREAKGKSHVESLTGYRNLSAEFEDFSDNSINEVNAAGTLVPAVGQISHNNTNTFSAAELEDITYSDDDDVGAEADFNNLETSITVNPIPTTRVHKDHPVTQIIGDLSLATQISSMTRVAKDQGGLSQINNEDFHTSMQEELLQFKMQKVWVLVDLPHGKRAIGTKWGIDYKEVFAPVARIEAIRLFLAYASFMGFLVYQMDVKSAFMYGTIKEEVYVCQPPGFKDPDHPRKVYKVVKELYGLHQAPRACQDKYVAEILKKFRLTDGKSASTPIDTKKPLLKDPDGVNTPRCDEDRLELIELTVFLLPKVEKVEVEVSDVDLQASAVRHILLLLIQKFLLFGLTNWYCSLSAISTIKYALTVNLNIYVSCIKQFWTTVAIKKVNDGVECLPNEEIFAELARMGYEKPSTKLMFYKAFFSSQWKFSIHTILQCMSAKRTSWNEFSSSMALAVICLSIGRKFNFSKYIFDSLVRNVDSPTKFYMYPRFIQLMIRKQVGDLSTHTTKYTSPALTHKVFANMRRVGKGFSRVETPLFEGMIVEQQVAKGDDDEVHDGGVSATSVAAEGDVSAANDKVPTADEEPSIPSPTLPTPPPQPSQDIPSTSQVQTTPPQSPQVQSQSPQPQPQPSQDARIPMNLLQELLDTYTSLTRRVKHLELDKVAQAMEITKLKQKVKKLERRNKEKMTAKMDQDVDVVLEDDKEVAADVKDVQDDIDESEDETEPAKVQEVVEVVTTAKLITKVVTAASETITTASTTITVAEAQVPAATLTAAPLRVTAAPSRRRKGDTGKGILVEEPKPLKKQAQIEQDEKYARELEAELNKNIDWDEVIDHLNKKAIEDPAVKRYQALKRKPQTEAQERKNMMIYLKNVAGFKMDYFKGMSYDDIRPIFEAKFNTNVAFLQKIKKQIEEKESRALKRLNETPIEKATKRQKLDKEVEELKRHLQFVPNEEDDVYIEATPLALKRGLGGFMKFGEGKICYNKAQELSDDFLLITLGAMFEKPDIHAQIWKNQRSVHGQAKVKSWKLLESCRVQIITFTTTQLILLVKRKYPLTKFTLN